MQLNIKSRNIELDNRVRTALTERIRSMFTRMGDNIARVTVTLVDTNGPRGGDNDIQCKVKLTMNEAPTIMVISRKETLLKAFSDAMLRAKSTVARKLHKRKEAVRQRPAEMLMLSPALAVEQV